MSIRLDKKWFSKDDALLLLRGNLGVYQLANTTQQILFIGYAGGKSLFGLKGEIQAAFQDYPTAALVRWEVTSAYMSRYRELLMLHLYDHDVLPPENNPIPLGKLRPAG